MDVGLEFADFVEEEGAAIGEFEAADFALVCAGEGTAFVAKQFTFKQIVGERGAVDGDKRLVGAGGEAVERAGDEFFACAGGALDEDGGLCGGDLFDQFEDAADGFGAANDGAFGLDAVEFGAQGLVFGDELAALDGLAGGLDEDGAFDGFFNKIASAVLHRFDSALDGPERGHEDHVGGGAQGVDGFEEVNAVHTGHHEVGDHEIDILGAQLFEGGGSVRGAQHLEAFFL